MYDAWYSLAAALADGYYVDDSLTWPGTRVGWTSCSQLRIGSHYTDDVYVGKIARCTTAAPTVLPLDQVNDTNTWLANVQATCLVALRNMRSLTCDILRAVRFPNHIASALETYYEREVPARAEQAVVAKLAAHHRHALRTALGAIRYAPLPPTTNPAELLQEMRTACGVDPFLLVILLRHWAEEHADLRRALMQAHHSIITRRSRQASREDAPPRLGTPIAQSDAIDDLFSRDRHDADVTESRVSQARRATPLMRRQREAPERRRRQQDQAALARHGTINWSRVDGKWVDVDGDEALIKNLQDKALFDILCFSVRTAASQHRIATDGAHSNPQRWLSRQPLFRDLVWEAIGRGFSFPNDVFAMLRDNLAGEGLSAPATVQEPWRNSTAQAAQYTTLQKIIAQPVRSAMEEFGRELRGIHLNEE